MNNRHIIKKCLSRTKNIAVVGAGPSGLTAARILAEKGNKRKGGKGCGGELNFGKKIKVFAGVVLPFVVEVVLNSHIF